MRLQWKTINYFKLLWITLALGCIVLGATLGVVRSITSLTLQDEIEIKAHLLKISPLPLDIKEVELSWIGLMPAVQLKKIELFDLPHEIKILDITRLYLTINIPHTLWSRKLKFNHLIIDQAQLNIETHEQQFSIEKFMQRWSKQLYAPPFDYLIIKNSQVNLETPQQVFSFKEVRLQWKRNFFNNQFRAFGTLAATQPTYVNFSGSFDSDQSTGKFYTHAFGLDLNQVLPWLAPQLNPQEIHGRAEIQLWVNTKENQFTHGALQYKAHDVKLPQLAFMKSMQGIVTLASDQQLWQVTGKKIYSSNDPCQLAFELAFPKAMDEELGWWHIKGNQFNIGLWQPILAQFNAVPLPIQTLLREQQPSGFLEYFHIDYLPGDWTTLNLTAKLNQVKLNLPQSYGTLSGLSGTLLWKNQQGKILVDGSELKFTHPDIYPQPLIFNQTQGQLALHASPEAFNLEIEHFIAHTQNNVPLAVAGQMVIPQAMSPQWKVLVSTDKVAVSEIIDLLPAQKMPDLHQWLVTSVDSGILLNPKLWLQSQALSSDELPLKLAFSSDLTQGKINYSPWWPKLSDIDAHLALQNQRFVLQGKQAKMLAQPVTDLNLVIPHIGQPNNAIYIKANVDSDFVQAKKIINASNLQDSLGRQLDRVKLAGAVGIGLNIDIPLPLKDSDPVQVKGTIVPQDATVGLDEQPLQLQALQGKIYFNQHRFHSKDLQATLWGVPLQLDLKNNAHAGLTLQANSLAPLKVSTLQQWVDWPWLNHVHGATEFNLALDILDKVDSAPLYTLHLDSLMQGVSLDLPAPLAKEAQVTQPLSMVLHWSNPEQLTVQTHYAGIDSCLHFKQATKDWQLTQGHIQSKVAEFKPRLVPNILLLSGQLSQLDMLAWHSLLKNIPVSAISSALMPKVDLWVKQLTLGSFNCPNTKLMLNQQQPSKDWLARINGPHLKGQLLVPAQSTQPLALDITRLQLVKSNRSLATNAAQLPYTFQPLLQRPLNLSIEHITSPSWHIDKLTTQILPIQQGYQLLDLQVQVANTRLFSSAKLALQDKLPQIDWQGHLQTDNFGLFMQKIGWPSSIEQGKGTIGFNLNYAGPWSNIDYATIFGDLAIKLKSGFIKGVNPGLGKILNILNLDTIQRRLQFDFSDLTQEGLAFDWLKGNIKIKQGILQTENLFIYSPTAHLEYKGLANLADQSIRGHLSVIPNISGSLPLAATIASGNPALGAVVWLVDKVIGKSLQNIMRYDYSLSGSWDNPIVDDQQIEPIKQLERH